MKITGTVKYINIGTGCWGIEDVNGHQYRPVNLPKKLQVEGKSVSVSARRMKEEFSVFMWGEAIEII